jgi:hypothetical protein
LTEALVAAARLVALIARGFLVADLDDFLAAAI